MEFQVLLTMSVIICLRVYYCSHGSWVSCKNMKQTRKSIYPGIIALPTRKLVRLECISFQAFLYYYYYHFIKAHNEEHVNMENDKNSAKRDRTAASHWPTVSLGTGN